MGYVGRATPHAEARRVGDSKRSWRDVWIGKFLGVLTVSVVAVLLMVATGVEGSDEPGWLLIGLAITVSMAAAVYEAVGWTLGHGIARVRRWWHGRIGRPGRRPRNVAGFRPSSAIWTLLAYVAAMFVAGVVVELIIGVGASDSEQALNAAVVRYSPVVLFASVLAGGVAALVAYRRLTSRQYRARALDWLSPGRPGLAIGAAVLGTAAAWSYALTVPRLVEIEAETPSLVWQVLDRSTGAGLILTLLTVVAVAPVVEELVFRGIVLDGFMRRWSELASVLVASLLFILLHAPDVLAYWPAAAMIGALGAAAAYVRLRSGAIGPAIALHGGYNLGVVAIWLL